MNIFVYGTLKSGHVRSDVLQACRLIGQGTTQGDLYDLGAFPAMVEGDGEVLGEVYECPKDCEARLLELLDLIEGVHVDFYERREVMVKGDIKTPIYSPEWRKGIYSQPFELLCWAYFFKAPLPPHATKLFREWPGEEEEDFNDGGEEFYEDAAA